MSAVVPVQQPITGKEHSGDLTQPAGALVHFYQAFNARDLEAMAANWEDSPEVTMDNPLGGIKRGWPEIRATVGVEFHDYTLHQADDVFWAIGRERGRLEADGRSLELAIRTSRVYRRSGAVWRQVHHHGSIEDPGLLQRYQDAVR
jgi:ketosteroid isomerase-like protein